MDCDMLVLTDIYELLEQVNADKDVWVVKHDYEPRSGIKFLGNIQYHYPKKNWSSLMVFNCYMSNCKKLTPEAVNKKSGKYLHQFEWSEEDRVGEISKEWNWLVGEYDYNPDAKIVHYTLGTPCFEGYEKQDYAALWFKEKNAMLHYRKESLASAR